MRSRSQVNEDTDKDSGEKTQQQGELACLDGPGQRKKGAKSDPEQSRDSMRFEQQGHQAAEKGAEGQNA